MADRKVTITVSAKDEFSQTFQKYNKGLDDADRNTKKAGQAANDFNRVVTGMIAAVTIDQVVNLAENMNQLGAEINATERLFTQLAGGVSEATDLMGDLRAGTMGVVDDLTLMAGATKLLNLGITDSNDQTAKLVSQILRLKDPTVDATTAINDFGLMMANASYLRLDTFNLSSARVRDRVNELAEEFPNLDRQARFTMATMEEMDRKINSLGDAANTANTRMARWQTTLANLGQELSQNFNTGVEASLGIIEYALGILPEQQAAQQRAIEDAAIALAVDFPRALEQVMATTGQGQDADFVSAFVRRSVETAKSNPALTADLTAFRDEIFQQMVNAGETTPFAINTSIDRTVFSDIAAQALQVQHAREAESQMAADILNNAQEAADAEARRADLLERSATHTQQIADLQERGYQAIHRQNIEQERMAGIRAQLGGQLDDLFSQMGGQGVRHYEDNSYGTSQYMTSGQASGLTYLADEAERTVEYMRQLDEANQALYSDDQLQAAQDKADLMRELADRANDAAEAFNNISLSDLFGRKDGGTLAELTDMITADLEKMQFTAEQIKGIQDSFDLMSGRDTATGQVVEDRITDVIAGVAANISTDLAMAMTQDLDALLKEATLRGIDTASPEFAGKLEETFATIDFDPEKFNVSEWLVQFDPAAAATTTMNEQGTAFADSTTIAADNMNKTAESVTVIGDQMTELSSKTHKLKIQPELVNIPNLIALLLPGLVQAVQAAGNTMPGTDVRASNSGRSLARGYE